jgi:hypothetical protein
MIYARGANVTLSENKDDSTLLTRLPLVILLLLPFLSLKQALASSDDPTDIRSVSAGVLRDDEDIRLDGRLDEPIWDRLPAATDFNQREPHEGAPATERTEVRIAYDRDNLYIGAMLYDSDPNGILAYQKQRDASLHSDDRFMLILDTFLDGRTAYFFETNPAGLMGDGLIRVSARRGLNKSWDGIWEAQVSRGDYGWSVEIEIPFRTLNFDPRGDTWGINFQRTIRRKQEETLWSGWLLNQSLFRPIFAGRVTGLNGMSQGLGLEVKPYGAASYKQNTDEDTGQLDTTTPTDVGADLTYSVTPSLRASLTVNTDFAEVEVDQRRVNLTRFPLFYPERRDFFLEGSSVFTFAPANGVNPYFSRRIGLVEGEPIPIVYGARLAGQSGRNDIGFLQVRTGQKDEFATEDFTVGRYKRNFFSQSSVGVIYTRRATQDLEEVAAPPDRHTVGVDLDLFTSTFLGDKNLQFEAFYVQTTKSTEDDLSTTWDRSARGIRINFPNDLWRAHCSYREFGENYEPAVGFVRRVGFRRVEPSVSYAPRPESISFIRQVRWQAETEFLADLDNRLLTRRLEFTLLDIRFESGDDFNFQFTNRFERLDEDFEISDGIVIPVGDYTYNEYELSFRSANQRAVSTDIEFNRGQFWSGERTGVELGLTVRPASGVALSADWEQNDVDLPEGSFDTKLARFNMDWQFNPWVSVTGILQYDNVSKIYGLYSRFRWILQPGSDLYFVYTHNWLSEIDGIITMSRAATTKINYTHRF